MSFPFKGLFAHLIQRIFVAQKISHYFQMNVLFLLIVFCFSGHIFAASTEFPICGVLTKEGYRLQEAKEQFKEKWADAILVVPVSAKSPFVKRYQVIDTYHLPDFFLAHKNWWVCIDKGKIVKEVPAPSFHYEAGVGDLSGLSRKYGIIQVEKFSADMSNGERGVE